MHSLTPHDSGGNERLERVDSRVGAKNADSHESNGHGGIRKGFGKIIRDGEGKVIRVELGESAEGDLMEDEEMGGSGSRWTLQKSDGDGEANREVVRGGWKLPFADTLSDRTEEASQPWKMCPRRRRLPPPGIHLLPR